MHPKCFKILSVKALGGQNNPKDVSCQKNLALYAGNYETTFLILYLMLPSWGWADNYLCIAEQAAGFKTIDGLHQATIFF